MTDVVKKISDAIVDEIDDQTKGDFSEAVSILNVNAITRAALGALAENVDDRMLQAACRAVHPAKWHEKRENEMRRALRAAILAAKG